MKYFYFPYNIKNLPKFIGMFLLGSLVGAFIALYMQGKNYDTLYLEKKELENYAVELQNTIDRFEKVQQLERDFVVKEITIETNLSDALRNVDIKREAGDLLKDLIGENVEDIDPNIIMTILNNRIVSVEDRQYRLAIRTITIAKNLKVDLLVTDLTQDSED